MKVKTYNKSGEEVGETLLPKEVFEVKTKADLLHQTVVSQAANERQGTAHVKNRGEVRGGGKKPWRQKGTGRARHGSSRSPIWRGGGTVFGPNKEKTYKVKINNKVKRSALLMALSAKAENKQIFVFDELVLPNFKTREVAAMIANLKKKEASFKGGKILIISPKKDEKLFKSVKNIPGATVIVASNLNAKTIFSFKYLFLTKEAISVLKKTFLKPNEI